MSIKKLLANMNHKCCLCKKPATHVSNRPVEGKTKFYFYCTRHATRDAVAWGATASAEVSTDC